MPRPKKIMKSSSHSSESGSTKRSTSFRVNLFKSNFSQSYTSLLYGVVTVIVLFALIFAGFRNFAKHEPSTDITSSGISTVNKDIKKHEQKMYSVQSGDSLWTIAEKEYNDGYKWTEIAKANKLVNPGMIEKGMSLVIPAQSKEVASVEVAPTSEPMITHAPQNTIQAQDVQKSFNNGSIETTGAYAEVNMGKITGSTYTVQHGDNLWNIAVRAYGDGFRWTEIAEANHLANPRTIFSGNVFIIPR